VWGDPINLGNETAYCGASPLVREDSFGLQTKSNVTFYRDGGFYKANLEPAKGADKFGNDGVKKQDGYDGSEGRRIVSVPADEMPGFGLGMPTISTAISNARLSQLYEEGVPTSSDQTPNDFNALEKLVVKTKLGLTEMGYEGSEGDVLIVAHLMGVMELFPGRLKGVGGPPTRLTGPITGPRGGSSWPTVKRTYWAEKGCEGQAPTRWVRVRYTSGRYKGRTMTIQETKELHHKVARRDGGGNTWENLKEVWPAEHAAIDPHRRLNYEVLEVLRR
jgi:hypothetical protein